MHKKPYIIDLSDKTKEDALALLKLILKSVESYQVQKILSRPK